MAAGHVMIKILMVESEKKILWQEWDLLILTGGMQDHFNYLTCAAGCKMEKQ